MLDIILETIIDTLKLIPFLFLAFLLIEYIEHKIKNKNKKIISNSKFSVFFGSLLGLIPQCGFSVLATNLYVTRVVSLGTLVSIYLSTSDEMLPLFIANKVDGFLIFKVLLIKFIVGFISGIIIDLFIRKKEVLDCHICADEDCHCEDNIFKSAFIHTLNIVLFLLGISFVLNLSFEYFGFDFISKLFMKGTIFEVFLASLVGLIPNCGSSVIITELYLNGVLSFGSLIGGVLTGSGVAILVLFKTNKNIKENLKILGIVYLIGVVVGLILNLFV